MFLSLKQKAIHQAPTYSYKANYYSCGCRFVGRSPTIFAFTYIEVDALIILRVCCDADKTRSIAPFAYLPTSSSSAASTNARTWHQNGRIDEGEGS